MDLVERPSASFARHPWEIARACFFLDQLEGVFRSQPDANVLDAGAGDGWFAGQLIQRYPKARVTCFDPNYDFMAPEPFSGAHEHLSFTAGRPHETFSVLLLLDVMEHIEHDAEALAEFVTNVRPGGHIVMSVPAWQRLFTSHDIALRHFRRYSPERARALVRGAGLTLEREGGLFHSLLVARSVQRLISRATTDPLDGSHARQHSLEWRRGTRLRRWVTWLLQADARFGAKTAQAGFRLPGLSWWSVCRKP
jgi:trans-aconitate methyltransferase